MKFSVIITNFNYGHYLKQAIQSALLVSDDVIVVDDGSTDGSFLMVLRDYVEKGIKINLRGISNQGVGQARNLGVKLAKHDYIICLDADDILNPEIKDIVPTTDIVAIGVQHFEGRNDIQLPPENITLELLKQGNVMPVTCPFSKEIWEKVGGFDEKLSGLEDYKFWVDCLKLGATVSSVRKPLLNYRIHSGGRNVEATKNYQELYKQIWD